MSDRCGHAGAVSPRWRATTSGRHRSGRTPQGDDGFSLLETIVSITLLGIVMTAATTFFVNVLQSSSYLRGKQVATQLADDAMDQARAFELKALSKSRDKTSSDSQWAQGVANTTVKPFLDMTQEIYDATAATGAGLACSVLSTPSAPACLPTQPVQQTVGGVRYSVSTYLGSCIRTNGTANCVKGDLSTIASPSNVGFYRVIVAVTWSAKSCPAGSCTYATAELQNVSTDPVFNLSTGSASTGQVNAALAVTSPGDQSTTTGVPVSLQLLYKGGTGQVTWTGTLPSGLSLDPVSGAIWGTPVCGSSAGCPVTITGTDPIDPASTIHFLWRVNAVPAISNPTDGQVITSDAGTAISPLTLTAAGGSAPYAWSITTLPAGLILNDATISGTPTTGGTTNITVSVVDQSGKKDTSTFSWTVRPDVVNPGNQAFDVGKQVNLTLMARGFSSPVTWTVGSGALPAGVSLNTATGVLSGTLTAIQTVATTVTATAGSQTDSAAFNWVVSGRLAAYGSLSGQCVDISGNLAAAKTAAIAYTCGAQRNQYYSYAADRSLHVTTGGADMCLTASGNAAGYSVVSYTCGTYSTLQTWSFVATGGGVQIRLVGSSPVLCLDASGTSTASGTPLDVVSCTDTSRSSRDVWVPGG